VCHEIILRGSAAFPQPEKHETLGKREKYRREKWHILALPIFHCRARKDWSVLMDSDLDGLTRGISVSRGSSGAGVGNHPPAIRDRIRVTICGLGTIPSSGGLVAGKGLIPAPLLGLGCRLGQKILWRGCIVLFRQQKLGTAKKNPGEPAVADVEYDARLIVWTIRPMQSPRCCRGRLRSGARAGRA